MTREDAIYEIRQLAVLSANKNIERITEALNMAIEALTMQYGEWVNSVGKPIKDNYSVYCSICGEWSEYRSDFCPNCGAEMTDRKTENCSEKPNNCETQTEGVWNAGFKTGYDKGYKDAQKVKDSQDLVKDLVKAFCEDGTWLERQGVYTLTLAEAKQRAVDIIESVTQTETQNSNLTFEKDECAKEYEELGLKELKELINADRKTEPQTEREGE